MKKLFLFIAALAIGSAAFCFPIIPYQSSLGWKNVKTDYGAAGDGLTNDTIAIQTGLNACSQASPVLYFPAGTYITTQLIVPSSCTLMGTGAFQSVISLPQSNINPYNYSLIHSIVALANTHFTNLGFRGNRPFQTTGVTAGNFSGWGFKLSSGPITNFSITNCDISAFGDLNVTNQGGGIWMGSDSSNGNSVMANINISDNHIGQNGGSDVYVASLYASTGSINGLFIDRNVFECGTTSGKHQNIVYVLAGTIPTATNSTGYNVHVDNNSFTLVGAIDGMLEYDGVNGGTIIGNTFHSTAAGVGHCIYLAAGRYDPLQDLRDIVIDGNTFQNDNLNDEACIIMLDTPADFGLRSNTIISNNTFYKYGFQSNVIQARENGENIDIHDNIITSTASLPISNVLLLESVSHVKFHDNIIDHSSSTIKMTNGDTGLDDIAIYDNNFSSSGYSGGDMIETFSGTPKLTNFVVRNNHVINPVSGTSTFASVATSTNTGNVLRDNDVYGGITATDSASPWTDIERNLGYNPVGASAISVTSSPFTYQAGVTDETVYVTGGVVSNITVAGVTVSTVTPTSVFLPHKAAMTVTYTSAPGMNKYVH